MGSQAQDAEQPETLSDELRAHCTMVALALADGEVVPFLGAGVNLCGRAHAWQEGTDVLPSGSELSEYLAKRCGYPLADVDNLVRVSQYQATMQGGGPLYKRLREVFAADYQPTGLHRFLAKLPQTLLDTFGKPRYQLIVTTNYDDALERAFVEAGQEYDLFTYIAFGDDVGKFAHTPPGGTPELVANPSQFSKRILDERPTILKIHGAIDRSDSTRDSFVITEDHYIDFLQRTDVSGLIPLSLLPTLQKSHFLFLGYSLRDWNLRVILQRIWEQQEHDWTSWAVQHESTLLDQKFWMKRSVEIHILDLLAYVGGIDAALRENRAVGGDSA